MLTTKILPKYQVLVKEQPTQKD